MGSRILFLNHTAAPGGAELFLLTLAKGLRNRGAVILFQDGPLRLFLEQEKVPVEIMEADAGISAVSREAGMLRQICAIAGAARLAWQLAARAKEFDVLFANSQKALIVGALTAFFSGKPLIWYLHDILTADHFSASNRRMAVIFANQCVDKVLANSKATLESFVAAGGRRELAAVIYNGFEAECYATKSPPARHELRRELGIGEEPLIGTFSRLAPWKGQLILLEAIAEIPGVHVLLAGAPLFGEEARYEAEVKARTERLGIANRVHFLGFRNDVPELLQAVDIVVHTSIAPEPFGRVIVEGMLAAKPVVATRAGGACEIIEDNLTGRLVAPGDARELASALRDLLDNPEKAEKIARAGQDTVVRRFSVERMLTGVVEQVEAVAGAMKK